MVLYVIDSAPSEPADNACALFTVDKPDPPPPAPQDDESGQACVDDIGIFRTDDL